MDLICDGCDFTGNGMQIRVYQQDKHKLVACGNCMPFLSNEYFEEEYKDVVHDLLEPDDITFQEVSESYLSAFNKYNELMMEMNKLKQSLFESSQEVAFKASKLQFLRKKHAESILESKEEEEEKEDLLEKVD